MDIPLVLSERGRGPEGPKRLVYSIPLWYRLLMGGIAAVLLGSILVPEGEPGILAWVILAIVLLGALYEESWILDAEKRVMEHRFGLLLLPFKADLPFDRIEGFRIDRFVRGAVAGGEEDRAGVEAEAGEGRGQGAIFGARFFSPKKAYVRFLADDAEGKAWVIDTLPAKRATGLESRARRMAAFAGRPLEGL